MRPLQEEEAQVYVVATGNAFDGISLTGPFDSPEEASEWADFCGSEWHLIQVENPGNKANE